MLKYVVIPTQSSEETGTTPSTKEQLVLANALADELRQMGIGNADVDENGYVYATIPATPGKENAEAIGLIAHMDTAPDFAGSPVRPQVIEGYDGTDVALGESGRVLRVSDFAHLSDIAGRTLITTDGMTL